ncbi:MAG: dihydrofolate reductase family protein [Anaerolineales bacterium]
MSRVILYIAISLDGYIADVNGGVSWLDAFQHDVEDYEYSAFYQHLGALIMGGNTYRQILGFGEWPYPGVTTHVVTSRELEDLPNTEIKSYRGDVVELVGRIKAGLTKDIWLVGGADLIRQFVTHNLIDEYIISIMPVLLGEGIPLLQGVDAPNQLELIDSKHYTSGVVQLRYKHPEG